MYVFENFIFPFAGDKKRSSRFSARRTTLKELSLFAFRVRLISLKSSFVSLVSCQFDASLSSSFAFEENIESDAAIFVTSVEGFFSFLSFFFDKVHESKKQSFG